jgi:hypothetical protein
LVQELQPYSAWWGKFVGSINLFSAAGRHSICLVVVAKVIEVLINH